MAGEEANTKAKGQTQKSGNCGACGKSANHRCSRCKSVLYCSADCQKSHWQEHKPNCKPPGSQTSTATQESQTNGTGSASAADNSSSSTPSAAALLAKQLLSSFTSTPSFFSENKLVGFKEVLDEINAGNILNLQLYIETLSKPSDGLPFSTQPVYTPDAVFAAIGASLETLDSLVEIIKKQEKMNVLKYKVVELMINLMKHPSSPPLLRQRLSSLGIVEEVLNIFFENQHEVSQTEILNFFVEYLSKDEDIDLLHPEELVKKTIEGLKEKASPFFLELGTFLTKVTNPKIAGVIAGNEEWATVVVPKLEEWQLSKLWTSANRPPFI